MRIVALGTAQDGGLPQAGCSCPNCQAAWADPSKRRLPACLALIGDQANQSWLIDATPALPEQLHRLQTLAPDNKLAGIFLTHAHIGHYTGLIHLGKEALNTQDLPLYATYKMRDFLARNAPWNQLLENKNLQLRPVERPVTLPNATITAVPVQHRSEFTDTVAYLIHREDRPPLFYCPDIDTWENFDHNAIQDAEIILADATFATLDELLGRNIQEIPHPLADQTRQAFPNKQLWLTHLNHSNPLTNRTKDVAKELQEF